MNINWLLIIVLLFTPVAYAENQPVETAQDTTQVRSKPTLDDPTISPEIRKELVKLHSKYPTDRAQAAYDLGSMGARASKATPFLAELLNDHKGLMWAVAGLPQEWTSPAKEAAKALVKIAGPKALDPLVKALNDCPTHSYCRDGFINVLAEIKDSRVIDILKAELKNDEGSMAAAEVLGEIGDRSAVGNLTLLFQSGREQERISAAKALFRLGDRSVEVLLYCKVYGSSERGSNIDKDAAVLLAKEGQKAVEPLIALLKDDNGNIRRGVVQELGGLKDTSAVEPLIATLRDSDEFVVQYAVQALGGLKDARAIEPLKDCRMNKRVREFNAGQILPFIDEALRSIGEAGRQPLQN